MRYLVRYDGAETERAGTKSFREAELSPETELSRETEPSCETKMSCETSTPGLAEFLEAHSPLLAELHARAAADRWGVAREEFAAALLRSAMYRFGGTLPPGDPLETYLRSLHLEDVALVCALQKGSEPAWEKFVASYRPILYGAARAIVGSAGEARARELADSLYAELYGVRGAKGAHGRAVLDYFHGRSKLATWLRTVLAQRHVDALRAAKRTESLEDDESLAGGKESAAPGRSQQNGRARGGRSRSHAPAAAAPAGAGSGAGGTGARRAPAAFTLLRTGPDAGAGRAPARRARGHHLASTGRHPPRAAPAASSARWPAAALELAAGRVCRPRRSNFVFRTRWTMGI